MSRFASSRICAATRRLRRDESGQSTAEFVLLLPFAMLLLLAVVQVGLLVRTRVMVTHAAREAVRVAAVGGTDTEIRAAAISAARLDPSGLVVQVTEWGGRVEVSLRYVDNTDVALVGPLIGDAVFDSEATMHRELR